MACPLLRRHNLILGRIVLLPQSFSPLRLQLHINPALVVGLQRHIKIAARLFAHHRDHLLHGALLKLPLVVLVTPRRCFTGPRYPPVNRLGGVTASLLFALPVVAGAAVVLRLFTVTAILGGAKVGVGLFVVARIGIAAALETERG